MGSANCSESQWHRLSNSRRRNVPCFAKCQQRPIWDRLQQLATNLHLACLHQLNLPVEFLCMDHSQSSLSSVISAQCSSPSEGSLAQSLRCEAKIANLTYRITFLSNFLSAAQQILDLVSTTDSIFSLYYEQVCSFGFVRLARRLNTRPHRSSFLSR